MRNFGREKTTALLFGRALQMGGDTGRSFFGPFFDLAWYAIRDFFMEFGIRKVMVMYRKYFPEKKREEARNRQEGRIGSSVVVQSRSCIRSRRPITFVYSLVSFNHVRLFQFAFIRSSC